MDTCTDRDYFYLCLGFLFPQHCLELPDRVIHRCGLLENVSKRCGGPRQRKKRAKQNSFSSANWVDYTSIQVESTTNFAHIFGISHL